VRDEVEAAAKQHQLQLLPTGATTLPSWPGQPPPGQQPRLVLQPPLSMGAAALQPPGQLQLLSTGAAALAAGSLGQQPPWLVQQPPQQHQLQTECPAAPRFVWRQGR
jgi:hypothetical protein